MEKAILKTLEFASFLEYPLKGWEVHKWLIGKKVSLKEVEKVLNSKKLQGKIGKKAEVYFLKGQQRLIKKRLKKEQISKTCLEQTKFVASILKFIPWIKLVGGTEKEGEIGLFLIVSDRRLWASNFLILLVLDLMGKGRRTDSMGPDTFGKLYINLVLEENNLALPKGNITNAYKILQTTIFWQRDKVYQRYLEKNSWIFETFPNWTIGIVQNEKGYPKALTLKKLGDLLENLAKWSQGNLMNLKNY